MNKNKKNRDTDIRPEETILNRNSDFALTEVYKSIRTNIIYSMPKTEGGKVIVLTSPSAGEGKTTACINLAVTFSQVNAKVILIDCDLRKPRVHRYLKLEKKDGLSNVLCGFSELERTIKKDVRENLDVITAGDTPPNPAEILQTEEFEKIINYLKTKYDYIILDTPPINVVTDASVVIKHSSGAILLVRKNYTTYDMVDASVDKLKKANANIIGLIVVDGKDNKSSYPYYKKSKYGYRYKYGYK